MSYVFCAAVYGKGVYLVADKRMCLMVNGVLTPYSDEKRKIARINDHLIMGFAGDLPFETKLFELISDISSMGVIYPSEMTSNIAGHFNIIRNEKIPEKVDIIIAGMEENGSPAFSIVSGFNDNDVYNFITSPDKTFYCNAIGVGKEIGKEKFEDDLKQILSYTQSEHFEEELFARVDAQIALVAKTEIGVSEVTDHLAITCS